MARKSFAESSALSQLMVKALQERGENLPVGVTKELVEKLDTANKKTVSSNVEQEKLKAQLKEKTAEFDKNLTELEEIYALIKKYIKIDISQDLWREFGIEDKK